MATQREFSSTSPVPDPRLDEERLLDDAELDIDPDAPLDAPIETPIEDALEQRQVEPIDDEHHDAE